MTDLTSEEVLVVILLLTSCYLRIINVNSINQCY